MRGAWEQVLTSREHEPKNRTVVRGACAQGIGRGKRVRGAWEPVLSRENYTARAEKTQERSETEVVQRLGGKEPLA